MRPKYNNNIKRLIRLSFQNLGRNIWLSTATTVMMGLILFIFNVVMVLNLLTTSSLDQLGDKVDLIIYISDSAGLYEISEMVREVQNLGYVKEASYTSKDEALSAFINVYPDKTDPFTTFGIENPLPGNLQIVTENPNDHSRVIDYLDSSQYKNLLLDVESSNENQAIIERLLSVTEFTKKLVIGVTVTFIFGSLLMIMNAIHLSIFTRKREIQIMQLVGAKPSMIRLPFLFEGAIYGLFAMLFSFFLLFFFIEGTNIPVMVTVESPQQILNFLAIELAVSIGIGVLSSTLAINYYLKRTLVLEHS
jgi:cell division transport system permease protein